MRMYTVIAGLLFSSSVMATAWTDPATGLTWKFNGGYLKGVEGNAEDLVIPSFIDGHKLDAIDSQAFSRREELKSVVISDGFNSIGEFAFDGCSGLSKVSIPDSVSYIYKGAFRDCTGLVSVSGIRIVDGWVVGITASDLSQCEITLPEGIRGIAEEGFSGGRMITAVHMPNSIKSIGLHAFDFCTSLTSVTLPALVTRMRDYFCAITNFNGYTSASYVGCLPIRNVTFSEGVTVLEPEIFSGFSTIASVSIPSTVAFLGREGMEYNPFSSCNKSVRVVVSPENQTYCSVDGAVYDKEKSKCVFYPMDMNDLQLPKTIVDIGEGSLCGNVALTEIRVPNGVTNIASSAFASCKSLMKFYLPQSVKTIGSGAFYNCALISEVEVDEGDAERATQLLADSGVDVAKVTIKECIPVGTEKNPWLVGRTSESDVRAWFSTDGELVIRGTGDMADFTDGLPPWGTNVSDVAIGDGVTSIGDFAFQGCIELVKIVIPASVKDISASAFSESGLKEIFFEGVPPKISDLHLPEGVSIRYNSEVDFSKIVLAQFGLSNMTPYTPSGSEGRNADCTLIVSNVVVHYVLKSVQPEFVLPQNLDTGFVNVIAEVKGGCVAVPTTWTVNYPKFTEKFGSDFTKALAMQTGKKDGAGNPMFVWQDYVAGTDPTDETDVFTASVTIVDGKVQVSYSPELDDARKALRKYTTWGKKSLMDTKWTEVQEGSEAEFNFFKVSVEMR